MFLFDKIVSPLFLPLPFCLLILIVGLTLLWFTERQTTGKVLISLGTLLLAIFGNPFFSSHLLKPLEHRFRPVDLASDRGATLPTVKYIVVLGGSYTSDPAIPENSQLGEDSLSRVAEGVMLYRRIPGSKLIMSGGMWGERYPESRVMAKVAENLGVSQKDILLESTSLDTEDEARMIQPMVGRDPFLLVTSAAHAPRAMALFKARGMNPIAAPTDYLAWGMRSLKPAYIYPSADGLRMTKAWIYENLGMLWAKIRNQV